MNLSEGLTFDDVVLVPDYSEVLPGQVSTATTIARDIRLNVPLMTAAMDTVTESQTAIAIAQCGGLGVVHKNLSVGRQCEEVLRVKKYQAGIVSDPIWVGANCTVAEVFALIEKHRVSGFPVLDGDRLTGIVTKRDLRFAEPSSQSVATIMTKNVVSAAPGTTPDKCLQLMREHRIEKLPLVDQNGRLCGLVTIKDLKNQETSPSAAHDQSGRLLCAAAVGPGMDLEERAHGLVRAGVDVLVMDTAHGHSKGVIEGVSRLRGWFKDLAIVAGNIVTAKAAKDLADAGADAVKVGIGPGSICTTRMVAGVGVPQLSAIMAVSEETKKRGIRLIADGGVKFSGDITKAMAGGADAVMAGSLFAGTDEAPGERILYQGRAFKVYRGMGSLGAMGDGSKDRYGQADVSADKMVPEGIEGRIPYRGSLASVIFQLVGGLRSGMGYLGAKNISELHQKARFVRISPAALRESHVHDVIITKEAPNYYVQS